MAYATSSDLTARFDARVVADLASDTGVPVADLSADAKVTAALAGASGEVESALTVANVYTAATLAALTGDSLALLKDLVCSLAMCRLLRRRQGDYSDYYKGQIEEARELLDRLRKGERVFGQSTDNQAAGTPTVDGPTAVEMAEMNTISVRVKGFYPDYRTRLPIGRA